MRIKKEQQQRIQDLFSEIKNWAATGEDTMDVKSIKKIRDKIGQNLDCVAVNLGEK